MAEMTDRSYATKGAANTGIALGATALGLTVLNGGLGNIFGGRNVANGGSFTCEDKVELTAAIFQSRITGIQENHAAREVINRELFELYKSGRDEDDKLNKRISDLEAAVVLGHERTINYIDKLDCMNVKAVKILPLTPELTGVAAGGACPCPCA